MKAILRTVLTVLLIAIAVLVSSCCPSSQFYGSCAASIQNPEVTLVNTYWALAWFEGNAHLGNEFRKEVHIELKSGSRAVTGSAGCNGFGGSYTIDGSKLQINKLAFTKVYCGEDTMKFEDEFRRSLVQVDSWLILDGVLELYDEEGVLIARFEAKRRY